MRLFLKHAWTFVKLAAFFILVGLVITREYDPPQDVKSSIGRLIAGDAFDFVQWEANTLSHKGAQMLVPSHDYLDEPLRQSLVQDYMELVKRILILSDEIDGIYADPKITDPAAASADKRAELARLRAEQSAQQTTIEAILQDQVSTILNGQGFALGGQVLPPVESRLTPLPYILITSQRDKIERKDGYALIAGLPTDRAEEIERQVETKFQDISALVEPIGGLGFYPAMLQETSSLEWTLEVIAHEWTHNWLTLRPLGMNYETSGQLTSMNETAANLTGKEIGALALARFYPELAPRLRPTPTPGPTPTPAPTPTRDPNAFDFRAEMRITRVEVDRLLAEARAVKDKDKAAYWALINQAEDYMHARREFFAEHGYAIRKLNQAYFAFHGAYADEPGAAGEDPVGPAVKRLRERSPSLKAFLDTLAPMTSFEDLQRALGEK